MMEIQTKVRAEAFPSRYGKRGKPIHATNADRQRSYRERQNAELADLRAAAREALDTLATALEQGRSGKVADNLPDPLLETAAALRELAARMRGNRLVLTSAEAFGRSHKRRKGRKWSRMFPAETRAAVFEMNDARRAIVAAASLDDDRAHVEARYVLRQLAERQSERYQRELRRALAALGLYD
jgi:hypothetical protein